MGLTLQGRDFIAGAIIQDDPNMVADPILFLTGNTAIGVGNDATAFVNTQTDLQAAVYGSTDSKFKRPMDAGYPSILGNVLTFRSTFSPTEANWTWNEWGVFNFVGQTAPSAPAGQYMLNRKTQALGLKTNQQTWQITVELTVTAV